MEDIHNLVDLFVFVENNITFSNVSVIKLALFHENYGFKAICKKLEKLRFSHF